MKKILIKALLILFVSTVSFSCQDLKEDPSGILSSESFFTTVNDLEAAVTAAYSRMLEDTWSGFGHSNFWAPFMGGDDTSCPTSMATSAYDRFNVNDQTGAMKGAQWDKCYRVIREANNVILNYKKVGETASIKARVAEVYFLRAWAYFMLVRFWDRIPLVLTMEVDYNLKRSPNTDTYKLIVEDLEWAIQNLPAKRGTYVGRPTVNTAKALLAQVYLMMGGYPVKDQAAYGKAKDLAKQVIDSGEYRLLDQYWDLWTDKSDNNDEVVWSIQFCSFKDCGLFARCTFIGLNARPGYEGGWNSYLFEEGFYKAFPDGPRKDATFWTTFEKRGSVTPWPILETLHYSKYDQKRPYIRKFRDGYIPGEPSWGYDSDHMGGRDINYLRYAEVLLIYAEAQCRADGAPNAEAYKALHDVQTRAGAPLTPAGLGKDAFVQAVFDERGWEFAGEYSRWFDLVRTENVEAYNSGSKSYKTENDPKPLNAITKEMYFMPIPYAEKQLNPNLDD